ncbi:MAG: DUF2812 domain-containing protein [Clostridiales bacterium]|nr:DUF2812 domain-containing protein [Clostridiales bacterium]
MKQRIIRPLAFPFGDYEGVRRYLDGLAQKGWSLTRRTGLFCGLFEPTRRTELIYDVVPADPRRTDADLKAQVRQRREDGWEPVDTLWGMDIYRSLPCEGPEVRRTGEDYRHWRDVFRNWLLWSGAFLLVTAAALGVLAWYFGLSWSQITQQWYLSDSRTMLCLFLPLAGVLALAWLGWLLWCLLRRCRLHAPSGGLAMGLRCFLQIFAVFLVAALLIVLWVSQIPRLWIRVVITLCFFAMPLLSALVGREDRQRRLLVLGGGILVCFLAAMVLGWTVPEISLNTVSDGSGWRSDSSCSCLLREELEEVPDGETVTAYYDQTASLLVRQERYSESWSDGTVIEVTVYTCAPGLAGVVLDDLLPVTLSGAEETLSLDSGSWHQRWVRDGNRVICLDGTPDWTDETVWESVCKALTLE